MIGGGGGVSGLLGGTGGGVAGGGGGVGVGAGGGALALSTARMISTNESNFSGF